jgi:hypothetical protein
MEGVFCTTFKRELQRHTNQEHPRENDVIIDLPYFDSFKSHVNSMSSQPSTLPAGEKYAKMGKNINKQRTKYMIAPGNRTIFDAEQTVGFGDKNLKVVNEFVYLEGLGGTAKNSKCK